MPAIQLQILSYIGDNVGMPDLFGVSISVLPITLCITYVVMTPLLKPTHRISMIMKTCFRHLPVVPDEKQIKATVFFASSAEFKVTGSAFLSPSKDE